MEADIVIGREVPISAVSICKKTHCQPRHRFLEKIRPGAPPDWPKPQAIVIAPHSAASAIRLRRQCRLARAKASDSAAISAFGPEHWRKLRAFWRVLYQWLAFTLCEFGRLTARHGNTGRPAAFG
jgi:hypothetical protein